MIKYETYKKFGKEENFQCNDFSEISGFFGPLKIPAGRAGPGWASGRAGPGTLGPLRSLLLTRALFPLRCQHESLNLLWKALCFVMNVVSFTYTSTAVLTVLIQADFNFTLRTTLPKNILELYLARLITRFERCASALERRKNDKDGVVTHSWPKRMSHARTV